MNFIADLESNISVTLSTSELRSAFDTWAHTAWYNAVGYVRSNFSNSTVKGAIDASRTITSSETVDVSHAYWGLDHIETGLKLKILNQDSLFAYYGLIGAHSPSSNRFFVVTDTNIYRFADSDAKVYFNGAKSGIINYTAAEYYTYAGDGAAATAATNTAEGLVSDFVNEELN